MDKIQLDTEVSEIRWLEQEELWQVTLRHMAPGTGDLSEAERRKRTAEHGEESVYLGHEIVRAKIIASAVGGLVEPKGWPEHIPGFDKFEGDIFHSARWDYNVNLNGKDVVVVGTGCSAAQFVPLLTKEPFNAKSVTQLMRSPPWCIEKPTPPFGTEKWAKYSPKVFNWLPPLARVLRTMMFLATEYEFSKVFKNSPGNAKWRKRQEVKLVKRMKEKVPEKYHEILTPNYGYCCKVC